MANPILTYFREAREEMRKVAWPSRRETMRNTLYVVGISFAIAAFLGLVDYILNIGLQTILER